MKIIHSSGLMSVPVAIISTVTAIRGIGEFLKLEINSSGFSLVRYVIFLQNSFPNLEIEVSDETDLRLERLKIKASNLFPLYSIYKNGVYKMHRSGKYDNTQIIDWLNTIYGLT